MVWRKAFPNLLEMDVDGAGNIYLSGIESVRKHSTSGTLLWNRHPSYGGYRSRSEDTFTGLEVAPDGDVVAVGEEDTRAKYDKTGRLLFREDRGVFREPRLALGPQEEIFLTFWLDVEDGYFQALAISKYSSQGNRLWSDSVVTGDALSPRIDVDSRGNAYLTGNYSCEDPYEDGYEEVCSDSENDAFVRKYGPTGNALWTRLFGTFKTDVGTALMLGSDEELYVAGYAYGKLTSDYAGNSDAFLRKMETGTGNRIWTR